MTRGQETIIAQLAALDGSLTLSRALREGYGSKGLEALIRRILQIKAQNAKAATWLDEPD